MQRVRARKSPESRYVAGGTDNQERGEDRVEGEECKYAKKTSFFIVGKVHYLIREIGAEHVETERAYGCEGCFAIGINHSFCFFEN